MNFNIVCDKDVTTVITSKSFPLIQFMEKDMTVQFENISFQRGLDSFLGIFTPRLMNRFNISIETKTRALWDLNEINRFFTMVLIPCFLVNMFLI